MRNRFGFILVKPQLGENIGASARALKNFGFSNLKIVSPKQSWPNNKAKAMSVGAIDIIKKAIQITKQKYIQYKCNLKHTCGLGYTH